MEGTLLTGPQLLERIFDLLAEWSAGKQTLDPPIEVRPSGSTSQAEPCFYYHHFIVLGNHLWALGCLTDDQPIELSFVGFDSKCSASEKIRATLVHNGHLSYTLLFVDGTGSLAWSDRGLSRLGEYNHFEPPPWETKLNMTITRPAFDPPTDMVSIYPDLWACDIALKIFSW